MASIKKRSNGSWRFRWRDAAGKEHARHFPRKVDAERFRDEHTADVVTGRYVDPKAGRVTFSSWFDEWSGRQTWEPGTLEAARRAVTSTTFRDMPLSRIAPEHVEEWAKAMTKPAETRSEGLAASTRKMRLNYVRMAFAAAVRAKRIPEDPSRGITVKAERRDDDLVIPTPEQVAACMAEADDMFRPFIAVCAFAGLRLGEAAGLQVGDVDFLRRRLRVDRQVQGSTVAALTITGPKAQSRRTVYVPEELTTMLGRHVEEVGTRGEDRYLFSNGGHLFTRAAAGHQWRKASRAAGVEGFTLHSLRHFFASGLIAAGCDVVTVQRAMGHAQPSITLDCYSSLWPDAEDRTRAAAADMMTQTLAVADSVRTEADFSP